MKLIITILRWIVGLLFIFSGIVKTIDPVGFAIKLEEYFAPDVLNLPFLIDVALPLSVFFVIFEVLLGILLILGIWKRFTLWSLLILILFFTFLTFYSAYFNKVTDCGCFGDAIKLTPWESFTKDVILLVMIIILWIGQRFIKPLFVHSFAYYILVAGFLICSYLVFQGIYHLPVKDFRAYAIGKDIPYQMKTAEELGLEPPVLETRYHLRNKLNDQKVTLSQEEYINDNQYWGTGAPWEIEDTDNKVISEGYQPVITDLVIDCPNNGDMTYHFLSKPKLVLVVTSVPSKASASGLDRVTKYVNEMQDKDFEIVSIASDNVVIGNLPTCLVDATVLKTMIRSNPGIIILEHGVVKAKYNWRHLPTAQETQALFN